MKESKFVIALTTVLALATGASADVKINNLFSDNAVLQQGTSVPVWGSARDGESVTVEFAGQKASAVAIKGKWRVALTDLAPGGPSDLIARGDNVVTAKNVLVGEVWLCSGQSNMARSLVPPESVQPRQPYWEEAAAKANDPQIRHFRVGGGALDEPTEDVAGKWEICTPATAKDFTAVGYFFARDLRQARKVPVGLINASVGATGAASWTSREALAGVPELKNILDRQEKSKLAYPAALKKYEDDLSRLKTEFEAAVAKAKVENQPEPKPPAPPRNPFTDAYRPTGYYNSKIAPLQPFAIKGVLWYQGESNSGQAREYASLFAALIKDWRSHWGQGDFPFLFVQLPNYDKTPPEMREVQLQTWRSTPNTAMVVTIDCGDPQNVHPANKEPVGARLALAARSFVYQEKITGSGPLIDASKVDGGKAVLTFKYAGTGIVAKGELSGFTIAGADKKFVPAKAEIHGETLLVWSDQVATPKSVRYAWENSPTATLYNQEGLPASPFQVTCP